MARWLKGMFAGQAVWLLLVMILESDVLNIAEGWLPQWAKKLDVLDIVGSCIMVLAMPVPVGGWLLIWGEAGPPYPWIESWPFNLAIGLAIYGTMGIVSVHFGPSMWRRFGSR
jgi:hypothetical protein